MRTSSILLAAWFILLPGLAVAGLSVNPIRIEKAVAPSNNEIEFIVSNSTAEDLRLTLSTVPLAHDVNGAPVEGPVGTAHDASKLIRFEQDSMLLPSRRWKRVRARVEIPSRPGSGYAFVYVLATSATRPVEERVVTATRVGIVVALTFPDPGKASVQLDRLAYQQGEFTVRLRNEGQRTVRPAGQLLLRDLKGQQVWSGELASANIYAELKRDFKVAGLPRDLAEGQYTLDLQVTAPNATSQTRRLAVMDGQIILQSEAVTSKN